MGKLIIGMILLSLGLPTMFFTAQKIDLAFNIWSFACIGIALLSILGWYLVISNVDKAIGGGERKKEVKRATRPRSRAS